MPPSKCSRSSALQHAKNASKAPKSSKAAKVPKTRSTRKAGKTTSLSQATETDLPRAESEIEVTFTSFPKLPAELQLKIWKYAMPGPRVIEIDHHARDKPQSWQYRIPETRYVLAISEPLPLLQVCQVSRAIFLKRYRLAFEEVLGHPFYFDPYQDTILMNNIEVLEDFCKGSRGASIGQYNAQFLALNPTYIHYFFSGDNLQNGTHRYPSDTVPILGDAIRKFATLRKLTFFHLEADFNDANLGIVDCQPELERHLESMRHLIPKRDRLRSQTIFSVIWTSPKIVTMVYQHTRESCKMKQLLLENMDE